MERVLLDTAIVKPPISEIVIERVTIDYGAKTVHVQWLHADGSAESDVFHPKDAVRPGDEVIHQISTGAFGGQRTLVRYVVMCCQERGVMRTGVVDGVPDPPAPRNGEPIPPPRRGVMDTVRGWFS